MNRDQKTARRLWDGVRLRVYGYLGRYKIIAIHIRRAATQQIQHSLVESMEAEENGEYWLVSTVADNIQTAFDVGANIGSWTANLLSVCPHLSSVSCFEPSEVAANAIDAAIGADSRVRIVRAAVSDQEGSTSFFEQPGASQTSSLVDVGRGETARTVPTVTVDEEIDRLSLERLDFLKIDVEGYDLHALRGARRALEKQAIAFVQFEYNRPWMYAGSTLQAAKTLLEECEYELFLLNQDGLCKCDISRLGELFSYLNFVAVPRANIGELPVVIGPDPLWD
jgi:FkbM family methyltransferase